jgi:hypothetical protein
MKLVVIDTTIDDEYNFYLVEDGARLADWHAKTFGHFYKVFSDPDEISKLVANHDFEDDRFEIESKAIIKNDKSVVVMSCSEELDFFTDVISCKAISSALSEFQFIVDECNILSCAFITVREVYDLNYVQECYLTNGNDKTIKKRRFGIDLYDFLANHNIISNTSGLYQRPNINENPHKAAIISQYLFRDNFEKLNLKVMDYWHQLHPEDRKYCRMIIDNLCAVRDEWDTEINDIEKDTYSDLTF